MDTMNVLSFIQQAKRSGRKLLAILLDPEKVSMAHLSAYTEGADLLFVGGSTGSASEELMQTLRSMTDKPLVLFPGQLSQLTCKADAVLFLSVLSSHNWEMLVGRQLAAARQIKVGGLESIPMGYILIDGGNSSSVARESDSQPLAADDVERIVDTAVTAELLGKALIYLEAGSGARVPVSETTIRAVRDMVNVPLIVGGGIRTPEQMQQAFRAGADIVVIGNHFEQHPEEVKKFRS